MPIKKVDRLEEGDVLASDITSNQGVALVKAGVPIAASHIRLFKQWGVLTVQVAEDRGPGDEALQVRPEHVEQAESQLRACFSDSLAGAVMTEVFRTAVALRAERLASREFHERDER